MFSPMHKCEKNTSCPTGDCWHSLAGARHRLHMLLYLLRCLFSAATGAALSVLASITLAARTQMRIQKELEVLEVYERLFV
tara:strand:- start:131 stop:373 length:243 start_codon:yes stop_codon:yes gene_type:complete